MKILIVCRLVRNPINEAEGEHLIDSMKKNSGGFSVSYGDFLRGHSGFCESTLKEMSVEKKNQGTVLTICSAAIFFRLSDSVYIFIF